METDLYKQLCLCVTSIVLGGWGRRNIISPPPTFSGKKLCKAEFFIIEAKNYH